MPIDFPGDAPQPLIRNLLRRGMWLIGACLIAASAGGRLLAEELPNVLLIVADDMRADAMGALGHPDVRTPHLDRLMARGTTFERAYCMGSTQPAVCVCSRASLLTGRTLFRAPTDLGCLPLLPEVMRLNDYFGYAAGKWHNGAKSFARSFDDGGRLFFGGMADPRATPVVSFSQSGKYPSSAARPLPSGHATDVFTDDVVSFIDRHPGGKPFFAYLALTSPHDPRVAPDEFSRQYSAAALQLPRNWRATHPFDNGELNVRDELLAKQPRTPEEIRRHLADYYAMVSHIDAQVGKLVAALERRECLDHTLVVFTSDNGLAIGSHGLMGKQNLYEHSVRVPLILAGPGVAKDRRSRALCLLSDLFPTMCEYVGVTHPDSAEGVSLVPVLRGERSEARTEIFTAYRHLQRGYTDGRYKLIRYPQIGKFQLFDLKDDPDELRDLAAEDDQASRIPLLQSRLTACQYMFGDPLVTDR